MRPPSGCPQVVKLRFRRGWWRSSFAPCAHARQPTNTSHRSLVADSNCSQPSWRRSVTHSRSDPLVARPLTRPLRGRPLPRRRQRSTGSRSAGPSGSSGFSLYSPSPHRLSPRHCPAPQCEVDDTRGARSVLRAGLVAGSTIGCHRRCRGASDSPRHISPWSRWWSQPHSEWHLGGLCGGRVARSSHPPRQGRCRTRPQR